MFQTVIIGMGRSGQGLHLPVLRRLRAGTEHAELFADAPIVVHDPYRAVAAEPDLSVAGSLADVRAAAEPATTVVHLCTPPGVRLSSLRQLAELGYRRILVEKPMATDPVALRQILRLRQAYDLRLIVVAPWLASALTRRLHDLVRDGELGALTNVHVVQTKPRLRRTFMGDAHPTAFDVEVPHSTGVAFRLAGGAEVAAAAWTDMRLGERVVPRMGTARMLLQHASGTRTEIFTDLTSPVRERRITLTLTGARVVGFYPSSADDHYAHLRVLRDGQGPSHELFADNSLDAFLAEAYLAYARHADLEPDLTLNVEVTRLLAAAKQRCAAAEAAERGLPVLSGAAAGGVAASGAAGGSDAG